MSISKYKDTIIKNLIVIPTLCSSTLFLGSLKAQTANKIFDIINYKELSQEKKDSLNKYIQIRESTTRYKSMTKEDQIPLSFVRDGNKREEIHPIPNLYEIYFLPKVSLAYDFMEVYQEIKTKYKEKTPDKLLILAQICKESCFQQVLGDHGESHGMIQLYAPTARNLLKDPKYKETFSKLFTINKDGNPVFISEKTQIKCVFEYLIQVCKFGPGNELNAITAYNNGIGGITSYTKGVLKRYGAFILFDIRTKNKELPLEKILNQIEHTLDTKLPGISKQEKNDIIYSNEHIKELLSTTIKIEGIYTIHQDEIIRKENPMKGQYSYSMYAPEIPENLPYILKKDIFTLYSVFHEQYREAIEFHNTIVTTEQEKIKLYVKIYDSKTKKNSKKYINKKQEIQQFLEQGGEISVNLPDTIYIKPGQKIYNYTKKYNFKTQQYEITNPYPIYLTPYIQKNSGIKPE